jgi:DNA polymerase-3 subunit beta
MRLSLPRSVLAEKLQIVSRAIPARSTIPALEGVLFQSDGQQMTLVATNLEIGIGTSFAVSHTETGKVVLPAKVVDIIKRLPGESVQINVDPGHFQTDIKSGEAEFQLYGTNADEFPAFKVREDDEPVCTFSLPGEELKKLLRQTLFAVAYEEGKGAFNGVFFSLREERLSLSSSDTFRLATTSGTVQNKSGKDTDFLIPGRILQEVNRVFDEQDDLIEAALSGSQLYLSALGKEASFRLLAENFPNVERVIPTVFSACVTVDTLSLQKCLERAVLLAEGINQVVRLSVDEDMLTIRAASKYGRIQEKISISLEGEKLEIALNARFMLDMLRNCEGDSSRLDFVGPNKPCVMRDLLHPQFLYLVLPIKI